MVFHLIKYLWRAIEIWIDISSICSAALLLLSADSEVKWAAAGSTQWRISRFADEWNFDFSFCGPSKKWRWSVGGRSAAVALECKFSNILLKWMTGWGDGFKRHFITDSVAPFCYSILLLHLKEPTMEDEKWYSLHLFSGFLSDTLLFLSSLESVPFISLLLPFGGLLHCLLGCLVAGKCRWFKTPSPLKLAPKRETFCEI